MIIFLLQCIFISVLILYTFFLYTTALKCAQGGSQYAGTAAQVAGNLVNVRSIAAHFRPKIDAWSTEHQVVTITPEQVSTEKLQLLYIYIHIYMYIQ